MTLGDVPHGRETEPGAALLGREEGLEGARADVFGHPDARVADRETHCVPALSRVRGRDVGGRQREPAALGHGVARVRGQVQDDLVHLVRVGPHRPEPGARLEDQLDVLSDDASRPCAGTGRSGR